ncbi:MAG: copper amine oxidase N-terminal domain-containing protein [Sedimentibacter saalensis]|jgi:hypothetical protein|nr:copper amine oxidase N-terminal domain-containing protein [Sedimentibacter saalensis]MEA5096269.1 copper amine oxidase N-terminal domain-containing protein [Sedimentibacter saalensis]
MKKIVFVLSLVLVLIFTSVTAFADTTNEIIISIDSTKVEFNDSLGFPFVDENNRTLVPFRAALEKFGATVDWNNESRSAVAIKGDIKVEVPVEQNYIMKNGEKIATDTAAKIVNGRTYLPIRAVIEAFGSSVEWDQALNTVVITTTPVDAAAIFNEANNKSSDWKNYDSTAEVHMSMNVPDDAGSVQAMHMKMNMFMTIFTNPMKAKLTSDMVMDVMGQQISQPVMQMYMSADDKGFTTYMGMPDSQGALTWMKSTVENEMFAMLMKYDQDTIESNKGIMQKYIKDVKYFGKYTDDAGRTLLRIQYSMSTEIYKDLLGEYVEELSASMSEQDEVSAKMFEELVSGNMGDLTFVVYIDEATKEIVKYEMDLSPLMTNLMSRMTDMLGDMTESDKAMLNSMKVTMVMEISNVNKATDFEIPAEALKAPEMPTVTEETAQ